MTSDTKTELSISGIELAQEALRRLAVLKKVGRSKHRHAWHDEEMIVVLIDGDDQTSSKIIETICNTQLGVEFCCENLESDISLQDGPRLAITGEILSGIKTLRLRASDSTDESLFTALFPGFWMRTFKSKSSVPEIGFTSPDDSSTDRMIFCCHLSKELNSPLDVRPVDGSSLMLTVTTSDTIETLLSKLSAVPINEEPFLLPLLVPIWRKHLRDLLTRLETWTPDQALLNVDIYDDDCGNGRNGIMEFVSIDEALSCWFKYRRLKLEIDPNSIQMDTIP